jgi:hypothetical protein
MLKLRVWLMVLRFDNGRQTGSSAWRRRLASSPLPSSSGQGELKPLVQAASCSHRIFRPGNRAVSNAGRVVHVSQSGQEVNPGDTRVSPLFKIENLVLEASPRSRLAGVRSHRVWRKNRGSRCSDNFLLCALRLALCTIRQFKGGSFGSGFFTIKNPHWLGPITNGGIIVK